MNINEIELRFCSTNSISVERAYIKAEEWLAIKKELKELNEWRAMLTRFYSQGLPNAVPMMPNDWSQDVAFVAYALQELSQKVLKGG